MQQFTDPQNLIQHIPAIMPRFCDKCGAKHETDDLEIVMNDAEKAVCKLSCKHCSNSYVIHINVNLDGVLSAKRASFKPEVTAKEIKKFSNFTPIESDEIIDVFTSMKSVSTIKDFESLFS